MFHCKPNPPPGGIQGIGTQGGSVGHVFGLVLNGIVGGLVDGGFFVEVGGSDDGSSCANNPSGKKSPTKIKLNFISSVF
jgi:hypothetical protein